MPHKDPIAYNTYHRAYTQKRLERARKKKLCDKCNGKIQGDHTKCENCRKIARAACLKSNAKTKAECFAVYGGKCTCCGESQLVFLTIDHVNGNGSAHRRELAKENKSRGRDFGGARMYRWLKRQGWPAGFQVLCWNCNVAKRQLGRCPHAAIPSVL